MLSPLLFAACLCHLHSATSSTTLRVFSEGGGDFTSVQAAVNSLVPGSGSATLLLKGVFTERVNVYANLTQGVDLIGLGAERPLITFNVSGAGGSGCSGTGGPGTFGSYTMQINADDVRLLNINVANSACDYRNHPAGQSVALDIRGDRVALFNCSLFGAQDTLYTGAQRSYFSDLFINGTCDSIFGEGSAAFERATIRMDYTVTAQKGNGSTAYLFLNSSVDVLTEGPGTLRLGRPWGPFSHTVFSGCTLGPGVAAIGWDDWSHNCSRSPPGGGWCNSTFYAEFDNTGPGYVPSARPFWAHILNATEGSQWTVARVLGDWQPAPPMNVRE